MPRITPLLTISRLPHLIAFALAACSDQSGPGVPIPVAVVVRTTGVNLDSNGYTLLVDNALWGRIGVNDSMTVQVFGSGPHSVRLMDVARNCAVGVANPVPIKIVLDSGGRAEVEVRCVLGGVIRVTTGTKVGLFGYPPAAYQVLLDSVVDRSIAARGSVNLTDVLPGSHSVGLDGLQGCTFAKVPNNQSPRRVTIAAAGDTVTVDFHIECGYVGP